MIQQRKFTRTWCDYLDKCPKFPNIEIGSYECCQCNFFQGIEENITDEYVDAINKKCDYSRYSMIAYKGVVSCSKTD